MKKNPPKEEPTVRNASTSPVIQGNATNTACLVTGCILTWDATVNVKG